MKVIRPNNESELVSLVSRIIAGDDAAEHELVSRYTRGIKVIIDRIVRNPTVTEDLSQETFRIVLEKLRHGDLRQPERLSGFVCSVARNAARDHMRRATRYFWIEGDAGVQDIPDPAPDQLDEVLRKERAEVVHQVINELSLDRDRQLLLRHFILEENKDKICKDLGITRIKFNYVIYRAVARFKELLIRKGGEP